VSASDEYDEEEIGGMMNGRGNRSTRRKPAPVPQYPSQTPTCCPDANPDRRGGMPETNRLIYGTASSESRWLPTAAARVRARSGKVGFVDKVALGQVFSEYFGVSCQFSFHRLLHNNHLSSEGGTMGHLVVDVPSGLSLTPPQETKKNSSFIPF
jgi:hypothetical protein